MRINQSQRHPVKIWASLLEEQAERQAENLASLPFIHKHVALMADAHLGKGSTVGAVIATKAAVIPAAVGVDIGCGMTALDLGVPMHNFGGDGQLAELRAQLEKAIPVGFAAHQQISTWGAELANTAKLFLPERDQDKACARVGQQLGSLGGGNHFIELCGDENDNAWLVIHSGSRYIGKHLADIHISNAKGLMKRYFIDLPDPDLAYLVEGTEEFTQYIGAMSFAQNYALRNRATMRQLAVEVLCRHMAARVAHDEDWWHRALDSQPVIDCHHNYTTKENHFGANVWVTRKGAVNAFAGTRGIIPGSMGTRSYIVEGLGNPDSFNSCAHGAGRRMSRNEARRRYTVEDLEAATVGVECRRDRDVVDEIPGAYKDIDVVMADQVDLVRPLHTLKQVLCVKG